MTRNLLYALVALASTAAVGFVDYWTGTEVRIFPLYFVPLVYAVQRLGRSGAFMVALLSSIAWVMAQYLAGQNFSHPWIWGINFMTQGTSFFAVSWLLVKLDEALKREKALGRIDHLTGLANSRAFYEQAAALASLCHRHHRPLTLVYVDLDNFKQANDVYGHLFGDELLQLIGTILNNEFRRSDLIARLGGDEFVALLPETNALQAGVVLEKVRQRILANDLLQRCNVTASVGAVCYEKPPAHIESLIKAADEVMYHVKRTGKNNVEISILS